MGLFNWVKKEIETDEPYGTKFLKPWGRRRITFSLADDVVEFVTNFSESTQIPQSRLIDMALRRFGKHIEDTIKSQEVEIPEEIVHNVKRSMVMKNLFDEDNQLIKEHESEQGRDREREEIE